MCIYDIYIINKIISILFVRYLKLCFYRFINNDFTFVFFIIILNIIRNLYTDKKSLLIMIHI